VLASFHCGLINRKPKHFDIDVEESPISLHTLIDYRISACAFGILMTIIKMTPGDVTDGDE